MIVEELKSPVPSKKTSFEELLICIFLAKEAAFEVFVCQIFDEEVEARSELLLSIVGVVDERLVLQKNVSGKTEPTKQDHLPKSPAACALLCTCRQRRSNWVSHAGNGGRAR